jgi:adenylate kinase
VKYRSVLLFGAPGSGKGTQGRVLGAVPGFYYFAMGDAFRNLRRDGPMGQVFFDYSSRGLLVPDEFTLELWSRHLQASIAEGRFDPASDTLVLDGIPRNLHQARMLQDKLNVIAVLHLTCADPQVLIDRLRRRAAIENRPDDAHLEVIQKRLETYRNQTRPVLDFYGPRLLHHIECKGKPVRVLRDLLNILLAL